MDPNSVNTIAGNYSALITWIIPLVSAFVGAIIGGIITGRYSLRAVTVAHEKELHRQRESEKAALQSLYRSIRAEVKTLWDHYQESMGKYVENLKEGQPLTRRYEITQDYFTVYRNNSVLIGRIPDDMLRDQIIKWYIKAQSMVEAYIANNDLCGKFEHFREVEIQGTPLPHVQLLAEDVFNTMVDYAEHIKDGHNNQKEETRKLVDMLEKKIKQAD